ncbi:MAG: DpnD/PcfM family protein [Ghiorsea sp.]|nr:DpnD/PcfM family protein [Ghiorsea sp.]
MKTYDIEVREVLSKSVTIEASDLDEALEIVHKQYKAEDIVLMENDFVDVSIFQSGESDEEVKDQLVSVVLKYLYEEENKHFEEEYSDQSENHIFHTLKKLKLLCNV